MGLSNQQKMMIAVLLAGTLLAVLNMTLLSPALPTIMTDLAVDATTVQWLTSGYALVEAVVIPLNAYLVGRFSTRKLFIGGIGWFATGSVVAAAAPAFPVLLLGRVMQAMATGVVMPMVFTLIILMFPREHRGSAMGIVGLIISFAPAIGPSLSGVLVDSVGWRALFLVVAALAVLVVVFAAVSLENAGGFERAPFDLLSTVLMFFGMIGLLYGLSSFTSSDNHALTAAMVAGGLVLLGLFVRRQMRLPVPMLRVEVLRTRQFRTTVILVSLLEAALVGSEVVMPIYVQDVLGQDATMSGLIMLPGAVIGALCGVLAGRLFDRYGARRLVVPGAIVTAAGGLALTTYGMATPVLEVCLVYTVMEIGIQFLITPLDTWGVNSLDNAVVQHGNSLYSTTNQVGASFGTALIVSLTGLGASLAAPGAGADEVTFAGEHAAFVGMCAMLFLVAVGILVFVRDEKAGSAAPAAVPAPAGIPGVDRPWLVADVMNAHAAALPSTATVHEAVELLRATETSGVTIVDEAGAPVGFVSDGDILKYLSKQDGRYTDSLNYFRFIESEDFVERLRSLLDLNVMRIATKRVTSIDAGDEAEAAFKVLSERRIKKLPVTSDGKLVGSLSRRNIISALAVVEQAQLAGGAR